MVRTLRLWAPVVVYMAAIYYVSSLPQLPAPPGGDKPWHLVAYLGFGVVVVRAIAGGLLAPLDLRSVSVALAIGIGYALTDEFHQMFVPGRTAQLSDLIADAIGVGIGVGLCWILERVAGPSHKSQVTRTCSTTYRGSASAGPRPR